MNFVTFVGFISAILGIISFIVLENSKKVKAFSFFILLAIAFFAGGYYLNPNNKGIENGGWVYYESKYEIPQLSKYFDYSHIDLLYADYDYDTSFDGYCLDISTLVESGNRHSYFIMFTQCRPTTKWRRGKSIVLDTLSIPKLSKYEKILTRCYKPKSSIIFFGIGKKNKQNKSQFEEITRTWKADYRTQKIEEVFYPDIQCLSKLHPSY